MVGTQAAQSLEVLGTLHQQAVVRGQRFDNRGRQVAAVAAERFVERVVVVERQDDRVARGRSGNPGARCDPEGGKAASRLDQEGVDVAVVAALELQH